MVIHKENKNVGVLGRILTQLMFVFFQRGIPSKSWPSGQAVPLSFSQELVFHLSVHICSDGPSSLIQNFFFRELTCCIKCFQPSFSQRLELLYFSFLFFPQYDQSSLWSAHSQIFHRQWPSHAFSIFFEPSLFKAWQQKITAV